ncbi:MAG TPA: YtxH domain-containing protein [Candidatus Saccharimonadales bacterium]|nr:YtxH domain-containing protein [Candidatus Saccharimonadales bacterium]
MSFKRKQHTGRKIAIGSALAGALGYLAGVLTAPKSGKDTREDLAERAGGVKDAAIVDLQVLEGELKDTIKSTKVKTIALSSSARTEFNEAVVKAKDAQNKASEVLKAAKKGEADDPDLNKAAKQAKQAIKNLKKYLNS